MVTGKNKDAVAKWKARLHVSQEFAKEKFTDNAKRWRQFYGGQHFPQVAESDDRLVINYTYSIIKAIIPQIYYEDPYVYVTANKKEFQDKQRIVEDALNFSWKQMYIKREMKKIILDMLVYGFGVGKVGYYSKMKKENMETDMEYSYLIEEEYPYFLRQSPMDCLFDPEAKTFDDIRWIATSYSIPLEEAKEKYSNTKDLSGASSNIDTELKDNLLSKFGNEVESDLKRVKVWEIQDLVDNKIYVTSDESDKFLRNEDNPYDLRGSNYKIMYTNPVPDELYPISEVEILEDLNLEYDKTRSQLMNHRRKSQRKIIYEDGTFESEEEEAKFNNDQDLVNVKVAPDMADKIQVFSPSMVQSDLYNNAEATLFDMNSISRVGFNQRATEGNVEKTATEADIIEKNANLGNAERLDTVTDYMKDLARDVLQILQDFSSKEKEFYVSSRDEFAKFKKEDIAGDYSIDIEIGSTTKKNGDEAEQREQAIYNALINLTNEDGKLLVKRDKLGERLMKAFGLSDDEIKELQRKPPKPKPEPNVVAPQGQPPNQNVGSAAPTQGQPPQGMPPQGNPQQEQRISPEQYQQIMEQYL